MVTKHKQQRVYKLLGQNNIFFYLQIASLLVYEHEVQGSFEHHGVHQNIDKITENEICCQLFEFVE